MTVKLLNDSPRYMGKSTDEKPIDSIVDDSRFWEYDTNKSFRFFDGEWYPTGETVFSSSGDIIDLVTRQQQEVDNHQLLTGIFIELKKINIHLEVISDEEITYDDIDETLD